MTSTNSQTGETIVTIKGVEFALAPKFKRIAKVEATLGRSLVTVMAELTRGQGMTAMELASVVHILSNGQDNQEKKYTLDEVGALVIREGIMVTMPKLQDFLNGFFFGEEDEDEGEPGNVTPEEE